MGGVGKAIGGIAAAGAIVGAGAGGIIGAFNGGAAAGAAGGTIAGAGLAGGTAAALYGAAKTAPSWLPYSMDKVGSAAFWVSDKVGGAAFASAGPAVQAAGGVARVGQEMMGHAGSVLSRFVNNSVDFVAKDPSKPLSMTNSKFKLTGMGTGLLVVGGIAKALHGSKEALEQSRQGTITGEMMTATPTPELNKTPSYRDDGGATGDLVFALNKLRGG